jgi:hypothetical protein
MCNSFLARDSSDLPSSVFKTFIRLSVLSELLAKQLTGIKSISNKKALINNNWD